MKSKAKRNQYHGRRNITPKDIDSVLAIIRNMPFLKRLKLSAWLVSYNFIVLLVITISATVVGMHYV